MMLVRPRVRLVLVALVMAAGAGVARDRVQPAELPPPDYAGQQYVDSKGCLFMRAGTAQAPLWLPRVTRQGVPLCGNPPSGRRVPVVEEGAAAGNGVAPAAEKEPAPVVAGYFVAVGSFGVAANVDRAAARLAALNYRVARGAAAGGGLVTVYAGPFADAAEAERARGELRNLGFPDALVVRAGP
jgi:hypothetical protein